jgi:hypothetical protein
MQESIQVIILQFIERYPESLALANEGYLPLHRVLENKLSPIDDGEIPSSTICRRRTTFTYRIQHQCRSAITSKYMGAYILAMGLYPESCDIADKSEYLLLHVLLENMSSSIVDALMMMENYPEALQYTSKHDDLPIHIECRNQ